MRALAWTAGRHLVAIWLASVALFALTRVMPQSPVEVYLSNHGLPVTAENIDLVRRAWGLDGPVVQQYFHWIAGILHGDWGTSVVSGRPVLSEMSTRLPLSLALGLGGVLLGSVGAILLGTCAETRGRPWSLASRALAVVAQAVPSFAAATLVIMVVGVKWHLVNFYRLSDWSTVWAPMLVLALYTTAQLSRVVAARIVQLRAEPFVRAAVGRGFPEELVLRRHGRRQVWYAVASALVAKMAWVAGGTAVLEVVFAVPGMSQYMVTRIQQRDYLVIQGYLLFMVLWMVASHVVLDVVMVLLAPGTRGGPA